MKPQFEPTLDEKSRDLRLPVVVNPQRGRAYRASHGRWRHCATFIAQLAGQYSSRRRDGLQHWFARDAVHDTYRSSKQQRHRSQVDEKI